MCVRCGYVQPPYCSLAVCCRLGLLFQGSRASSRRSPGVPCRLAWNRPCPADAGGRWRTRTTTPKVLESARSRSYARAAIPLLLRRRRRVFTASTTHSILQSRTTNIYATLVLMLFPSHFELIFLSFTKQECAPDTSIFFLGTRDYKFIPRKNVYPEARNNGDLLERCLETRQRVSQLLSLYARVGSVYEMSNIDGKKREGGKSQSLSFSLPAGIVCRTDESDKNITRSGMLCI